MFFQTLKVLELKLLLYTVYFTGYENFDTQCLQKESIMYSDEMNNRRILVASDNTAINIGNMFILYIYLI